jgi:hypothetical protein
MRLALLWALLLLILVDVYRPLASSSGSRFL